MFQMSYQYPYKWDTKDFTRSNENRKAQKSFPEVLNKTSQQHEQVEKILKQEPKDQSFKT